MKRSSRKTLFALTVITVIVLLLVITSTSSLATKLPFLEDGKLYKSRVGDPTSLSRAEIASNVWKVLDYDQEINMLLYITKPKEWGRVDGNLWLLDTTNWTYKEVATGVIGAQLSPGGDMIVIWNKDHEIWLISADGIPEEKIGIHGAAPIFSHDGRYIAYEKLPDSSFDGAEQSLFEFAQGIAIYDLMTGQEMVLTQAEHGEDFAPVGFSQGMKRIYFNSTRGGIASLWSVNLDGSDLRQETNSGFGVKAKGRPIPVLSQNAIWSSNKKIAVSSIGTAKEIWIFHFGDSGELRNAKLLTGGESPEWLIKDKRIAFRVIYNGKSKWQTMDIQQ